MKKPSSHLSDPQTRVDVIVVGMGPGGATAARELAQQGFSVLAFDKLVHPRYKVCGGGLSARIERFLPDDFKAVVEKTVFRVQFMYGGEESFFLEFPQPVAYMVRRPQFDRWLVDKAIDAGTDLREGESVEHLHMDEVGAEVRTSQRSYQSRFVIGADGAMSLVAQHLFPGRRLPMIPALESEYHGPSSSDQAHEAPTALISLSAAEKGYGWVFPKKDGLSFGVGEFVKGANRPRRSFDRFIHGEKRLAGLIIPPPLGYPLPIARGRPADQGNPWTGNLVSQRALLVGDAAHLVDPLLGEGIYYAVRSGHMAAKAVADALHQSPVRLQTYEESINQAFGAEFFAAAQLNRIIYGLPRPVHRWAGRWFPKTYQRVLRKYCEVLQGRETYQGLWNRIRDRIRRPWAHGAQRG